MANSDTVTLKSRLARSLVKSYPFSRGKDRLFLLLRAGLGLPKELLVQLDGEKRFFCDLDEYMQRWIFCHGVEADPDYVAMKSILAEGDKFVDVGANVGVFSLLGSSCVGHSGMVFAIEAAPTIRPNLERNLSLNGVDNVKVLPFALSDECGSVKFYLSAGGNNGASSLAPATPDAREFSVESVTLDKLVADGVIAGCDVMKIDIEGAEVLALKGMTNLLSQVPPRAIMIEIGEPHLANFNSAPAEVINLLSGFGYEWFRAANNGLVPFKMSELTSYQNLWAIMTRQGKPQPYRL